MSAAAEAIQRDDVDQAIEAWARWAREALSGLGWPPVSLLAKVIEYGVRGAAQAGGIHYVETNAACEIVDRAIRQLPELERRVVVVYYTRWQPRESAADYCGVSEGYFRKLLSQGRRGVKDYLRGAALRYHDFPENI